MVEKSVLIDALKKAKEQAPERKFTESVDMTINLKNIDMNDRKTVLMRLSSFLTGMEG